MILTWRLRRNLIWITNLVVISGIGPAAIRIEQLFVIEAESVSHSDNTVPRNIGKPNSNAPSYPSPEQIAKAAAVSLQRMQPPRPLPTEVVESQSPPIASPPPPDPVVLFAGSLVGTIVDNDHRYSFAILQWPDNRVRLVSQGNPIDDSDGSPTIVEVKQEEVVLRAKNTQQVIKLKAN